MREVSHLPHFFEDKNRGGTMKDLKEIVEPLIQWFREKRFAMATNKRPIRCMGFGNYAPADES